MNIFFLDRCPKQAAVYQCDRHVIKMILESAQMLCVTMHEFNVPDVPYGATHRNHPCSIWARSAWHNHLWLLEHAYALAEEHRRRWHPSATGYQHASVSVLDWCAKQDVRSRFPQVELTMPALAMPDDLKCDDPVESYRRYYRSVKAGFATWRPPAERPHWWELS